MNPSDQRIDQLLQALGTTGTPAGLEQRINARVAQRTDSLEKNPLRFKQIVRLLWTPVVSHFAVWPSLVAIVICMLGFGYLLHHEHKLSQHGVSESVAALPSRLPIERHARQSQLISHRHAVIPSREEVILGEPAAAAVNEDDPDAIAMAETFAPSHPAPPLPLSEQETEAARRVHRGAPVEVAMFDPSHDSALIALATAHDRASIRRYVHGLLGPLATAQSLTSSALRADDGAAVADSETSSPQ